MTGFQQFAHQQAQRDIDVIRSVVDSARQQNYDIKQMLLSYQQLCDQQGISISRDSMIYKTLLKMSLIRKYATPSVYSLTSNASEDASAADGQVTWPQRIEIAYQWIYREHLCRIFRHHGLQTRVFWAMRHVGPDGTQKSANTQHQLLRPVSSLQRVFALDDSQQKPLKELIFERLQQRLKVSSGLSAVASAEGKRNESSMQGESRSLQQIGKSRASESSLVEPSSSVQESRSQTNSQRRSQGKREFQSEETRSSKTSSRESHSRPSVREEQPNKSFSAERKEGSEKHFGSYSQKENRNITVDDSFNQFLKQQLELDNDVNQKLKSVTSLDLSISGSKFALQAQQGVFCAAPEQKKQPQPDTQGQSITPATKAPPESQSTSTLRLSKQVLPSQIEQPSSEFYNPQTQSSLIAHRPDEAQRQFDAVSIIAAIDQSDVVTADQIMQICFFKALLREKIDSINRIVLWHALLSWKLLGKQVVCCQLRIQACIVRGYAVQALRCMRGVSKRNSQLIESAQGLVFHQRNVRCLKAMQCLQKEARACRSARFDQNTLCALLERRRLQSALRVLDEQIAAEEKSEKYIYFKRRNILQFEQQKQVYVKQLKAQDADLAVFYNFVQHLRRTWVCVFPSVQRIADGFLSCENGEKYYQLQQALLEAADDAVFDVLCAQLRGLMASGYDVIPAACHTLRRPVDYLNFLTACMKFQLCLKARFVQALKQNVLSVSAQAKAFALQHRFGHWRRMAQFRRRMQNIDAFVQEYYEKKILKKRALSSLLMEAGHKKLIALVAPRVESRQQKTAFQALRDCAKERRLGAGRFLQQIDAFWRSKMLRRAAQALISKYQSMDDVFQQIFRRTAVAAKRRAFAAVLQATAVALFRAASFNAHVHRARAAVLAIAVRLYQERTAGQTVALRCFFVYQRVSLHALLIKYKEITATGAGVFSLHRLRALRVPFICWRLRWGSFERGVRGAENLAYQRIIIRFATPLFRYARLLFKGQEFARRAVYRQKFAIMYRMRQFCLQATARRANALAYFTACQKQRVLCWSLRFWRGLSKLQQAIYLVDLATQRAVFAHWRAVAADKAHFYRFQGKLEGFRALAAAPRFRKPGGKDAAQRLESRANPQRSGDKDAGSPSSAQLIAEKDPAPLFGFALQPAPTKAARAELTWLRMLSLYAQPPACMQNERCGLILAIRALQFNAQRQKALKEFFGGLGQLLDIITLKAALRALNQQRRREIALWGLVQRREARAQRSILRLLKTCLGTAERRSASVRAAYNSTITQKALRAWVELQYRRRALEYLVKSQAQKRVLCAAFSIIAEKAARLASAERRICLQTQRSLQRRILSALARRHRAGVVLSELQAAEQRAARRTLRRVFQALILRANQFIQFKNGQVDRIERSALSALGVKYQSVLTAQHALFKWQKAADDGKKRAGFDVWRRRAAEVQSGKAYYIARQRIIARNLFRQWRKCCFLLSSSTRLQAVRRQALQRAAFAEMRKQVFNTFKGQEFSEKRSKALLASAGGCVFALARAAQRGDEIAASKANERLRAVFAALGQASARIGMQNQVSERFLTAKLKAKAFSCLRLQLLDINQLQRVLAPIQARRAANLAKSALGTWAVYCARMQAVRLGISRSQTVGRKIAFQAWRGRLGQIQSAGSDAQRVARQRLKDRALTAWREQAVRSRQSCAASARISTGKTKRLQKASFSAWSGRSKNLRKNLKDQTARSAALCMKAGFEGLEREFRRLKDASEAAGAAAKKHLLGKALSGVRERCEQLRNGQSFGSLRQQRRDMAIVKNAFQAQRRRARLSMLLKRLRIGYILRVWAAQTATVKLNLQRADLQRKANLLIQRAERNIIQQTFKNLKATALTFQQMQRAADEHFWRRGQWFYSWRQAAWERRRRGRAENSK